MAFHCFGWCFHVEHSNRRSAESSVSATAKSEAIHCPGALTMDAVRLFHRVPSQWIHLWVFPVI